ncbi:hypothetical protein N0614_09490 [Pseudomonas aeruginosa]|nr:hypothetical protein [Pseudomonas aeruginosa]
MSITRILLLSIFLSLAGCGDQGSRGGDCGVSPTNANRVEGFNNDVCKEDKFFNGFGVVHKNLLGNVTADSTEAHKEIQNEINSNDSKRLLQERSLKTTSNNLRTISTLVTIYAAYYFIAGISVLLLSRAREEQPFHSKISENSDPDTDNPNSEKNLRYNNEIVRFNVIAMVVAFMLSLPIIAGGYSFASRLYATPLILNGFEFRALIHSYLLSGIQTGNLTENELSETSRKYSISYFKAYSTVIAMTNGALSENRTSKVYYEKANYVLGTSFEKRVEAPKNTKAIYLENGDIKFKRLIDGKQLSNNALFTFESKPLNSRSAQAAYNKLSPSYITSDPTQIVDNAQRFETALKNSLGIQDTTPEIQLALVSLINESVRESLLVDLNTNLPEFYALARLHEELACSVPAGTNTLPISKSAERAIRWLKNQGSLDGPISCVGQPDKEFIAYGKRDPAVIEAEIDKKFFDLVDSYYMFYQKIESSTLAVTLNSTNSDSCIRARKEGLLTMEDKNCLIRSNANRDLVNAVMTSFRAKGYGEGSFVQTNYLRNNNLLTPTITEFDFNDSLKRMFKTINITTDFAATNQKELIDTLADSYQDDKLTAGSMIDVIFSPISTLKTALRIPDNCKAEDLTTCVSPLTAYAGLRDYTQKIDQLSFWLMSSAFAIGATVSEANNMMDKSSTKDVEISKKGKISGKGFIYKAFEFTIAKVTAFAVGVFALAKLIQYEMAMPDILVFVAKLIFAIFIYMYVYIVAFRFINFFYINDKNNLISHLRKIGKEAVYLLFYPTILTIFGFIVIYFSAFQAMIAIEIIAFIAEGGGFNDYISAFMFTLPILHLLNSNVLRMLFDLLNYFIESTVGSNAVTKVINQTTEFLLKFVTLGFPTIAFFTPTYRKKQQ